jgi:anthranilate phosphoribosyltransferase
VRHGNVSEWRFDPADHGVARATVADLRGGDVDDNRRIAEAVLGGAPGAPRDIVVVGAAAALLAADLADGWPDGMQRAVAALDSGEAADLLQRWVAASRELAEAATRGEG